MASFLENIPAISIGYFKRNKMIHYGTVLFTYFQFGRLKARLIIQNIEKIKEADAHNSEATIQNDKLSMTLSRSKCSHILAHRKEIENFANDKPLDQPLNIPAEPDYRDYAELKAKAVCIASGKLYKNPVEREVASEGRPIYTKNWKPFNWNAYLSYKLNQIQSWNII